MSHFESNDQNTLGQIVKRQAQINGEKPIILYENREISYRVLDQESDNIAMGLKKNGVTKDEQGGSFISEQS